LIGHPDNPKGPVGRAILLECGDLSPLSCVFEGTMLASLFLVQSYRAARQKKQPPARISVAPRPSF
jgi:hypothetical protein